MKRGKSAQTVLCWPSDSVASPGAAAIINKQFLCNHFNPMVAKIKNQLGGQQVERELFKELYRRNKQELRG
jgi:hypothetical protein